MYSTYAILTMSFNTLSLVALIITSTAIYLNVKNSGRNFSRGHRATEKTRERMRKRKKVIARQVFLSSTVNWSDFFVVSVLDIGILISNIGWLCIGLFVLPLFAIINPCVYH